MKKKKHIILWLFIILIPCLVLAQGDRDIFNKAKMNLFEKKWESALKGLDKIINDFPESHFYSLAFFYKGKCLEEMSHRKEAWKCYHTYLDLSNNKSLKEEATSAVINLDFILYEKGEVHYLAEIKEFLKSKDWVVRTYAAFKLSYAKDKKVAALAVPVLRSIVSREKDDMELVDRSKIALLRIDPGYLKTLTKRKNVDANYINIKIFDKGSNRDSFSFKIPFALARLALDAIPDKEKKMMKEKGYDLDGIVKALIAGKDIIKIESEDSLLRIWID